MEEWLQTEWPQLRVHCTSVTEQWATFPVVGPRSRDVIGAVFPDVDVSNEAFPFMTWRDTTLDGVPVRLARISFSGELAYEVYVNPWYALGGLAAAARGRAARTASRPTAPRPCTCCGPRRATRSSGRTPTAPSPRRTSAWRWAVSKKKPDFVGKRSFARAANQDPLRKQLVGLLPVDRQTVLPEGSQIVEFCADGQLPPPPVPMLGHVTSSYRSAELGAPVRPGPGQGRAVAHRRAPSTSPSTAPSSRSRSPARCWSIPKEPAAMADSCCAPTRSRRGATAFAGCPTRVGITAEPFVAMVDVRLGAVARRREPAGDRPADRRPTPGCRPTAGRVVWLGPDEWLLTSTAERPEDLEARVRAAVVPLGGAAVGRLRAADRAPADRARGSATCSPRAAAIDLHPRVFGRGSSAQTTLGLAGVVLLALGDAGDDYLVLVRSSFAGYLADWLLDAAVEYTAGP